jgi:DNA-binding CsgD family transcriptional regulator
VTETVIGRDRERGAIASFLDGGNSRPTVLVLEGDSGIGKTMVWKEAAAAASRRGYRVLAARPLEAEKRISFAAVGELLDDVFDEIAAELPDPQRRALEVALLLADPEGPPPDPQAIAFAFLSALRALASARRTLVAVDDLQWLDQSSAALLTYAARRLGDEPIRFLVAARTNGETDVARELKSAVDEARLERILLGPLTAGAMQHLFREQLGASFPRPVLHRIHATSGGNPFHALELGRALARLGRDIDPGESLPVSTSLSDLLGERLASLPDATSRALQTAALSSEPTLSLLEAAMDEAFDLAPAVVVDVVTLEHDRVTFAHPLYSSGIAARMSEATRKDVHRRLAQLGADPEERAHHLALSVSKPDADIAAELESAAHGARARGSPTASAELLEHALRLSPRGEGEVDVVRRTIAAADAHFQAGDTKRALALLESLSRDLPPGPDRAQVLYRLAAVRGELDYDLAASIDLYERALGEPTLEPLLAARIHSDLAWLATFVSNVSDGLDHAETAVDLAGELDSPATRAEALTALSFAQTLAGRSSPDGLLDPALALESSGERFRIDRSPSLVVGIKLLWSGDLEAARLRFESLRTRAFERGDETNTSIARYHLAMLELQSGHVEEAFEHAREAAQLAEQTGVNVPELRLLGAVMDAHLGQAEAAISAATELLGKAERAGDRMNAVRALGVLGFVDLSRGHGVGAHAHLARALELSDEIGLREPAVLRFIPDAVEALVNLGRPTEAESVLKRFEEPARRVGHAWALASVDRCRGLIRAATDDLPGGLADLERARAAFEQLPFPFELARTLLALGTVERRAKRRRVARASLEAALQLFEQLSALLWADRTRAELEQIGGRTSSGLELTPQERRIAELVAAGGTNREVAAALFVSVHTIEGALTRIYGKVGVRSRTELASRLAERESKL